MNKHRFGAIWAVVLGLSMIFFLAGCSSSGDGVAGSSGGQTATTLATEVIGFTSSVELTSDNPEAVPKGYVPDCTEYDDAGILTTLGKINPQTESHTDGILTLYLNVYRDDNSGWFLDWENATPTTTSVLSVVVNSAQGGYLYLYDGSVVADTGLHAAAAGQSGNFHEISYAAFCYLLTNGNGNGEKDEGCSLGYWGATRGGPNAGQVVHGDSWGPTGYEFTERLDSVFTGVPQGEDSLLTALRYKGGPTLDDKKNLLLKQAVAGLLNAAHPDVDYPLTEGQLIALVNARLAMEDMEDMNDILNLQMTLDAYNNLGCPLD